MIYAINNAVPPIKRIKIVEEHCSPSIRSLARRMYVAYCENSDNLNFQGSPCPTWENLPMTIRAHWCAAAIAARPDLATS